MTHSLSMLLQDLTARACDSLVSFGERLSTRLFAALLNSQVCRRLKAHTCQASCIGVLACELRTATEVVCFLVGQNVPLLWL